MLTRLVRSTSRVSFGTRFYSCYTSPEKRALVSIDGKDANVFLKNLVTYNTDLLETGGPAVYSMFLNFNGRVICDTFIYPKNTPGKDFDNQGFMIECDKDLLPNLMAHFKMYKVRLKLTYKDVSDQFSLWTIWGKEPLNDISWEKLSTMGCTDPRVSKMGIRVILPKTEKLTLPAHYQQVPNEDYHIHRIVNGIGEGIQDVLPMESLPFECNLDYGGGVHFDKGCYLGQELTARTHHRGVTRKRLLPVQLFKDLDQLKNFQKSEPEVDKSLKFEIPDGVGVDEEGKVGKPVGKFGTKLYNIALVTLRLNYLEPNQPQLVSNGLYVKPFKPSWWPEPKKEAPSSS